MKVIEMKKLTQFCLFIVLAFPLIGAGTATIAEATKLTIIHFNDLDQMGGDNGRGGVAKLAAIIAEERQKNENVLVTFGGDTISPSLMSALDKGAHMIELLNRLDLTAMALGNHEFDFGPEIAKQRIAEATFPILSANNADPNGNIIDGALKTMTVEVNDYQIGIIGLTTVGTLVKSSPGEFTFLDPVEVAAAEGDRLREGGADLIIALAHTDVSEDQALVSAEVVDILLSGDDHSKIVEYSNGTLYVESGEQAELVTILDVFLDQVEDDGKMEFVWSYDVRIVDSIRYEADETLAAKVASFEAQLDEELAVELGTTLTALDSRRDTIRAKEAAIGNLFADAIRANTKSDISLVNGGGIRGNKIYDAGTVLTRRDIQSELPFGNKVVVLEVTGQVIIDALENGYSKIEDASGRFPHLSGLEVVVDQTAEPGNRLVSVTHNGQSLDPNATFRFAVNNYVAGGGDGYSMFPSQKVIIDENAGVLDSVHVFNYITEKGSIDPQVEGRIKFQ